MHELLSNNAELPVSVLSVTNFGLIRVRDYEMARHFINGTLVSIENN